jgi:hypothetical protein
MERQGLTPEQLIQSLRQEVEAALRQVAAAVDGAPLGRIISASEHQVKDVMDELRTRVFERALQLKAESIDSAFSPGGSGDGSTPAQQGLLGSANADGLRLDGTGPAALAQHAERAGTSSGRRGVGRRRSGDQRGGDGVVLPGGVGRRQLPAGGGSVAGGGESASER